MRSFDSRLFARWALLGPLLASACVEPEVQASSVGDEPELVETLAAEYEALAHAGNPSALHWTRIEDHTQLSCIDGRAHEGVVGTPGGDAGELLLLIAAAERRGVHVEPERVPELLDAWLAELGSFYMHTDEHALRRLGVALAGDPRFAGSVELEDPRALERWLHDPPERLREPLLAYLIDPDAVGCGHLASLLRHPEDYGVRRELAGALIQAFYRRLWREPAGLRFVVLQGEHHEQAILDVEVTDALAQRGEIPQVVPDAPEQVFVIQPQAIARVRERAAALGHEWYPELDEAALHETLAVLGRQQLDATLRHLHVHVPMIRVVVDHQHTRAIAHDHAFE